MSNLAVIDIQVREELGKRASNRLRKDGYIPGAINEKGKDSIAIKIKADDFNRAVSKYGESQVYKLKLNKKTYNAMIKEIQVQTLSFNNISVVFQHISLDEETKSNVEIRIDGRDMLESNRFTLTQQTDSLAVKGLPNDIPNFVSVDVSSMQPGDVVTVGDINLPKNVTAEVDGEQIILSVAKPRIAEEDESDTAEQATEEAVE